MIFRQIILTFALWSLAVLPVLATASSAGKTGSKPPSDQPIELLIRADDMGMSHGQNEAFRQLIASGLPVSVSVMWGCPWWKQAVDILRNHDNPNVSVGVHLTLNAEWREYRWGPILGASAVPSLVDAEGYFFPSRATLFGNNPDPGEIEAELRAQIQRAVSSGVRIDYVDYHMGAAVQTSETRAIVEKLAAEYGLAISRWFGETSNSDTYSAPLGTKTRALLDRVEQLTAEAVNLQVFHIAPEWSDMNAMTDLNTFGLPDMAVHRHEELNAVLSEEFREAIASRGIRLITYRDLVRERGLGTMVKPPYYP
jgi:chitin disaccharide deacetylase